MLDLGTLKVGIKVDSAQAIEQIEDFKEEISDNRGGVGGAIQKLGGATKAAGDAMEKAGGAVTNFGKKLLPVSAATGGFLTGCVKGASDFEDSMAKMSTLVDTSTVSLEDLSDQFLDLSSKTGISATELAEAGYQALSAGVNAKDSAKFVETAGNLAKAGFTQTSTAVDVLTTVMNAYGESAGSADEIANKLVRTQNLGKTTVDELGASMGKIIPTASAMNVDVNNLTSGYVSLTKQGIGTAEATTYMNAMLNELGKSSTAVGGILKEKTGKSFQELMDSGMSLGDVLSILQDSAKESGTNFNELWSSSEAGKSALAILNGGVEDFNKTVETMKSDTDDVGEALDKLHTPSQEVREKMNGLKNATFELGQKIMELLLPAFEKIVGVVNGVVTWFSNLDDKHKTLIATIGLVVTALAPVIMAVGGIISVIGTIVGAIGSVISIVGVVVSTIGGVLMPIISALFGLLMANPLVLIVTLIGGVVVALATFISKNEAAKQAISRVWNSIKSFFSSAISGIVSTVSSLGGKLVSVASNAIHSLLGGFQSAWGAVTSWVSGAVDWVSSKFSGITSIVSGITGAISSAAGAISGKKRIGFREVPYDGYVAELHKGEMVLTANEANQYQKQMNGSASTGESTVIVNNYSPKALSVVESARLYRNTQRKLQLGF